MSVKYSSTCENNPVSECLFWTWLAWVVRMQVIKLALSQVLLEWLQVTDKLEALGDWSWCLPDVLRVASKSNDSPGK